MPPKKYDIKLVKETTTKKNKMNRKHIHFERLDKKEMPLSEVKTLYKELVQKSNLNPDKAMVIGMSKNRYFTLKTLNQDDFKEFDEEYLENKPAEVQEMLREFYSFDFVVLN